MTVRRVSAKQGHMARGVMYGAAIMGATSVLVGGALVNPAAGQSTEELLKRVEMLEAERVHSGVKGVKVSVTGQVNRMVVFSEEGEKPAGDNTETRAIHVADNSQATSSRFRFIANGQLNDMVSTEGRIEIDLRPNRGNSSQVSDRDGTSDNSLRNRLTQVSVKHAQIGKLTIGQQWLAGWGAAGNDSSGTGAGMAVTDPVFITGARFRRDDNSEFHVTDTVATGFGVNPTTVGNASAWLTAGGVYDGLAVNYRGLAIRYDTPNFAGASAAFSYSDDRYQAGFSYSGSFGATKVTAGVGYHLRGPDDAVAGLGAGDRDRAMGSVAFLFGGGFNFSFGGAFDNNLKDGVEESESAAQGIEESEHESKFGWRVAAGYKKNFTGAGNTNFVVGYHRSENRPHVTDLTTIVSAVIQQDWNKTGTNLYLIGTYINHDNKGGPDSDFTTNDQGNRVAIELKPIFQVGVGARQRF